MEWLARRTGLTNPTLTIAERSPAGVRRDDDEDDAFAGAAAIAIDIGGTSTF